MKILITLTVLLFIFSSNSFSQTQEATIFFHDGDSIKGYGMVKKNRIKFRVSLDSKGDYWSYKSIKKIQFPKFDFYKTYEYVKLNTYSIPILLELVVDGDVALYRREQHEFIYNDFADPNKEMKYYLKRSTDKFLTCMNCKNKWLRLTTEFLSDCEDLIKKIKARELVETDMEEIIEYYNDLCAEF